MPIDKMCEQCGTAFTVIPARELTARFCSRKCHGLWNSTNNVGTAHPRWTDSEREKICTHCGEKFSPKKTEAISTFSKRKFCSKKCADVAGFRNSGENHPNWTGGKNPRRGEYARWARQVISRDGARCQSCGIVGVEMHAHHIEAWKENESLRFVPSNGITLCHKCHWHLHSAAIANGVNSVELLSAERAEDNTEPSLGGNTLEGVTTRGRAYRRWDGNCHWCGKFMSRRLSDVTGKAHVFCSKHCMGKHGAANRTWRRWQHADIPPTAVISSTSAPVERHDIV